MAEQAARRRQQPKRGCSALTAPADDADASQSTGSAKRRQLSSPSDEQRRTPSPTEPRPGQRLLRSTSRAAAPAPSSAPDASASSAAKSDRQPRRTSPVVAGSVAGRQPLTPSMLCLSGSHVALGPFQQASTCCTCAPHSRGCSTDACVCASRSSSGQRFRQRSRVPGRTGP